MVPKLSPAQSKICSVTCCSHSKALSLSQPAVSPKLTWPPPWLRPLLVAPVRPVVSAGWTGRPPPWRTRLCPPLASAAQGPNSQPSLAVSRL